MILQCEAGMKVGSQSHEIQAIKAFHLSCGTKQHLLDVLHFILSCYSPEYKFTLRAQDLLYAVAFSSRRMLSIDPNCTSLRAQPEIIACSHLHMTFTTKEKMSLPHHRGKNSTALIFIILSDAKFPFK